MAIIKRATSSDAAILLKIGKTSFLESHGHSASATDIDIYLSKKYTLEAFENDLKDESNLIHLIFHDDQPVGYSKIIFNQTNPSISIKNTTLLDRLYLLKDYVGLKLGQELLYFNLNLSKSANQNGIWLFTWIENHRAINFYKKEGFEIVGKADFKISENHSNPNHIMFLDY